MLLKKVNKLGKIYSVASGVRLTPSEIRDTAETNAYRNGYPNEGKEMTSYPLVVNPMAVLRNTRADKSLETVKITYEHRPNPTSTKPAERLVC